MTVKQIASIIRYFTQKFKNMFAKTVHFAIKLVVELNLHVDRRQLARMEDQINNAVMDGTLANVLTCGRFRRWI